MIRTCILTICFSLLSALAWAQQDEGYLRQSYMEAEEAYNIGRFDASIQLLNQNMDSYSGSLKVSAYRLMTLCYLGKDNTAEAERYTRLLLQEAPYYNAAFYDPLRFADMLERLKRGEEATITTASQQAESVEEAPVPVTLITEEMIKASGAKTLADLLSLYVPGMTMIEGLEANMAMHGVYSTSQEKILVMLDGHRLNSRTTNAEALDFRNSLDKIKQIEVLRGPASSLYGNVALTAVINIIPKTGREVDGVKVSAGIGNYQTYRADFLMGKSGFGIDFMAWASVYSSRGEKRYVGVDDDLFYGMVLEPKSMYIGGYNHKPSYDIGFIVQWNDLKLMFNEQYSKKVSPYNTVHIQSLYTYDKYRTINGSKPGRARQSTHLDLTYEKQWGKWSSKWNAFFDMENCSYYDVGGDSILPDFRALDIPADEFIGDMTGVDYFDYGLYQVQSWEDYTYGGNLQLNYAFQKNKWKGVWLLGAQVERYTMKDNSMLVGDHFDRVVVNYSDRNRALSLGKELNLSAFTNLKTYIGNHFIFNGGVRYDYKHRYNNRKFNVFSPRVSFIYEFVPEINLKIGYSHSFVDAPYLYRGSTIPTYAGGSTLDPEQMDAVQLTFNHAIPEIHLKYEANVYYNRLTDLIGFSRDQGQFVNSGGVDVMGVEASALYKNDRTLAHLNLSYQWLLDYSNYTADGDYIYFVPNLKLGAMFQYQFLKTDRVGNAYANINATVLTKQKSPITGAYRGEEMLLDLDYELKARAIFNAGLRYDYKKFSLSANLYNLLNTAYSQGGPAAIFPIPQQSIGFMFQLSYDF